MNGCLNVFVLKKKVVLSYNSLMSIQIRDSIHGSIVLTHKELQLIDHPAFQRLRNIKQLGFADLAFPGATHSRYSHSLGAMEMATQMR